MSSADELAFFCINLESNAARLAVQVEQARHHRLRVVRVPGVVPDDETYRGAKRRHEARMMRRETQWRGPAANAIVLSWVRALRFAAAAVDAWVLVGEDDAVFASDFRSRLSRLDRNCFLHALGMPAPYSEHAGMSFGPPPTGWGPGAVFEEWPIVASSCRVMAGNPAVALLSPAAAARLADALDKVLAAETWNPIDQLVSDVADDAGICLAADPGLCWELARQDPDAPAASSDRQARDRFTPTRRRFKWGSSSHADAQQPSASSSSSS